MRHLALGIAAVFGLGIALGSLVVGASSTPAPGASIEEAMEAARLVDCGEGRKAVVEPALSDGAIVASVTCASIASEDRPVESVARQGAHQVRSPSPAPAPAPAPAPEPPPAPAVAAHSHAPTSADSDADDTASENERVEGRDKDRTWKDRALVIGGAAGAGAGIGALAKGGKGAAVGAAIGGVAGTVYELTKKKN